jgi:hypothetical protein
MAVVWRMQLPLVFIASINDTSRCVILTIIPVYTCELYISYYDFGIT